jgi:hypothetical protein
LEERGWIVSGAPSASASSRREGGKGGKGTGACASVVMVKTSKKKMDHEHYLDATQRCVPTPSPISSPISSLCFSLIFPRRACYYERGIIKALNASKFGAPSNQATVNASPSPASHSFGGLGLGSTFAHFRSQLSLPPSVPPPAPAPAPPQPDHHQLESAAGSGQQGVGSPAVGGGAQAATTTTTTTDTSGPSGTGRGDDGRPSRGGVTATTRDSLYDMADRFSAWPSEKIDKAKRLRDQFLSKV